MGRLSAPLPHGALFPVQGLTSPFGKMPPLQASDLTLPDEEKSLLTSSDDRLRRALPGARASGSDRRV